MAHNNLLGICDQLKIRHLNFSTQCICMGLEACLSTVLFAVARILYQSQYLPVFQTFFFAVLFCFVYPQLFLDNIDTMVIQLDSATSLNLFLMDLKEENMTQTMYAAAYRRPAPTLSLGAGRLSKVDVLCDAMLESLYRVNPNKSVSDYYLYLIGISALNNVITINLKHSIMLSMQLLVFSCITASICLLFDFCTNFPNTILPFYSICFI